MLIKKGSTCDVVAFVGDWDIVVSEFEFKSQYLIHFRTNTLKKGMNPLVSLAISQTMSLLFFHNDGFGIK